MSMYKIITKGKEKSYKVMARCNHCGKRYVVIQNSKDSSANFHSRYYCSDCCKIAYPQHNKQVGKKQKPKN